MTIYCGNCGVSVGKVRKSVGLLWDALFRLILNKTAHLVSGWADGKELFNPQKTLNYEKYVGLA